MATVSCAAGAGLAARDASGAGLGDGGVLLAGAVRLGFGRAVGDGRDDRDGSAGLALAVTPSGASAPTGRSPGLLECGDPVQARAMMATSTTAPSTAPAPASPRLGGWLTRYSRLAAPAAAPGTASACVFAPVPVAPPAGSALLRPAR